MMYTIFKAGLMLVFGCTMSVKYVLIYKHMLSPERFSSKRQANFVYASFNMFSNVRI